VLDIRLAVNPWIPLQQRMQQPSGAASTTTTSSSMRQRLRGLLWQQQQQQQQAEAPAATAPASLRSLQGIFKLDSQLQGRIDYAAAGGPLSAAELASAVVISHSLPGAPLAGVLADVARFLQEQPSEVSRLTMQAYYGNMCFLAAGAASCWAVMLQLLI
jgi:hypothetical protein